MTAPKWLQIGFPSICFALGTWQVYRWRRKSIMIQEYLDTLNGPQHNLESLTDIQPNKLFKLPKCELDNRAKWIGPRAYNGGLGYIVVVPIALMDGKRALLNLGWSHLPNVMPGMPCKVMMDCKSEQAPWHNSAMLVKNINALAYEFDTEPVMLKSAEEAPPFSNRHLEYILTWYSLGILSLLFGRLKK
jgi:cytochrome oxidase assembly protein ShyY1